MFTNLTTQLAREQQRQMLAAASQHSRHQHGHRAPATPGAATRIIRSLAAAIASTSAAPPSAGAPRRLASTPAPASRTSRPAQTPKRSR